MSPLTLASLMTRVLNASAQASCRAFTFASFYDAGDLFICQVYVCIAVSMSGQNSRIRLECLLEPALSRNLSYLPTASRTVTRTADFMQFGQRINNARAAATGSSRSFPALNRNCA